MEDTSPDFLMWSWFTLFTRTNGIHFPFGVFCYSYKTLKFQLDTWPFKMKTLFPIFHCYQIRVSCLLTKENQQEMVYATHKKCAYRSVLQDVSVACSSVRTGTSVWNGTHLRSIRKGGWVGHVLKDFQVDWSRTAPFPHLWSSAGGMLWYIVEP